MTIRLLDVYSLSVVPRVLWYLLKDRPAAANISHKEMPTPEAHAEFVESKPYESWYLIQANRKFVGSIYLTRDDEIGVAVVESTKKIVYTREAIIALMELHPRERYKANIAPKNKKMIRLFRSLGFGLIQHTYAMP